MTKSITKNDLDTIRNGIERYFEKVESKHIDNLDRFYALHSLDAIKKEIDNYRQAEATRQSMLNALQIVSNAMSDKKDGIEIDSDWAISEALTNIVINY